MIGKECGYNHSYVVSCRGVVQLGDLVLGSPWWVPLSLMLVSLLCSLKSSIVQKIKSTWLSLLLRLFFYDLLQCSTQRQSVTINVMPPQINQSSSTQIKNRRFFWHQQHQWINSAARQPNHQQSSCYQTSPSCFFIGPSYTNICTPLWVLNEEDLPPGVGAHTRPLWTFEPGNLCKFFVELSWVGFCD